MLPSQRGSVGAAAGDCGAALRVRCASIGTLRALPRTCANQGAKEHPYEAVPKVAKRHRLVDTYGEIGGK